MKFFGLTLAVLFISGFVFVADAGSVQKRNVFNDVLTHAHETFNDAKTSIGNFFNGAFSEQIAQVKESFIKGLNKLQDEADEVIDNGVDAIETYLPGLKGIITERVDKVTEALDKYVTDNSGKLDQVRKLILENAQKTLKTLKERLHETASSETVNEIVNSVDKIENTVVNEVSAAKSRSLFGINWSGLKQTVQQRFDSLRNRFDDMLGNFRGEGHGDKIREHKDKIEQAMNKVSGADKLPAPQKIEAVKEATAELNQADKVASAVASQAEDSTSASV